MSTVVDISVAIASVLVLYLIGGIATWLANDHPLGTYIIVMTSIISVSLCAYLVALDKEEDDVKVR